MTMVYDLSMTKTESKPNKKISKQIVQLQETNGHSLQDSIWKASPQPPPTSRTHIPWRLCRGGAGKITPLFGWHRMNHHLCVIFCILGTPNWRLHLPQLKCLHGIMTMIIYDLPCCLQVQGWGWTESWFQAKEAEWNNVRTCTECPHGAIQLHLPGMPWGEENVYPGYYTAGTEAGEK